MRNKNALEKKEIKEWEIQGILAKWRQGKIDDKRKSRSPNQIIENG